VVTDLSPVLSAPNLRTLYFDNTDVVNVNGLDLPSLQVFRAINGSLGDIQGLAGAPR